MKNQISEASGRIVRCAGKTDPFARIDKEMLDDMRLSFKAKGILSYLLGKPEGWKLRVNDLCKRAQDGQRSVRAGLQELRDCGYIKLSQERVSGRIAEWIWQISDSPIFTVSPDVRFEDVENSHLSKNEFIKNDLVRESLKKSEVATFSERSKPLVVEDELNKEIKPEYRRDQRTKEQKLKTRKNYSKMLSEEKVDEIIEKHQFDRVANTNIYERLCRDKWSTWNERLQKWQYITDIVAFLRGLDEAIGRAKTKLSKTSENRTPNGVQRPEKTALEAGPTVSLRELLDRKI